MPKSKLNQTEATDLLSEIIEAFETGYIANHSVAADRKREKYLAWLKEHQAQRDELVKILSGFDVLGRNGSVLPAEIVAKMRGVSTGTIEAARAAIAKGQQ